MPISLRLKQLAVIPLLAVLSTAMAWADVPPPKPDLSPLYEQWQLDESTIAELEAYFQQMREARESLREQDFASRQERRDAMRALRDTHRANLETILDEDQLQDLKAYMRQFGHRRGGHKKQRSESGEIEG
ncbi:hypothetical protein FKG94_18520 [Exilibacterium tricleocarpae]|uniref:Periplasmic heavy metal sensor n=1 Tax=Exilibacterium tricleocarpae TaxID=2591008 RepID=A0A545T640_9GAMM|nr:hypothetical protein [Exilibacterium tricleocarpae]TQV72684.1 hypothetical protein FKG94_18520 [Exilibacterium tricleocarpae]